MMKLLFFQVRSSIIKRGVSYVSKNNGLQCLINTRAGTYREVVPTAVQNSKYKWGGAFAMQHSVGGVGLQNEIPAKINFQMRITQRLLRRVAPMNCR